MKSDFKITGISKKEIQALFNLNQQELAQKGIKKLIVDENPGYPCRVSLEDAAVGEEILAFNYEHHKVNSPYKASGPVFVRLNAQEVVLQKNEIPKILIHRVLSLRVYDAAAMMIDAQTTEGKHLKDAIHGIFANKKAQYIQIHNSSPGCYNCQVDRA